ncbi:MAG: His/Gly/Thr/Pro-type tRNA ligase C-terminal domain-containing protein [archaeon]|jgi:prolyl-tRNA synthetase|nr:His/Gly/Thr/Pro-type tRNA ligase C-terminal domain-containing protein [archaeon]
MRQSFLFTKTRKQPPRDEESINAKLLEQGGFVRKELAGVYSFLPLGWRVIRKIEEIIREEMEAIDGQEIFMPSLQPVASWKKTGNWDANDILFRFKAFHTKNEYVLGPTHEEVVTPLMKEFVSSYKDLPKYVFQIQNKFRDEKRAKSGLLRGREFIMKDLYSFDTNEEQAEKYYLKAKRAYEKIYKRTGLKPLYTFAAGGTFAKYSHEFQVETPAGEDTIFVCEACKIAINDEIIAEQNTCPECKTKDLRETRAIEVGNIFKLKTKYSEPFDLSYTDAEGKKHPVIMGCYGIGLGRLMGTVVEIHHDDNGIIWPKEIAPFSVHIVALTGGEKEADTLYKQLQEKGIGVLYDDRKDVGAGEKLKDADLLGIPTRVVISERTMKEKSVEIKERKASKISLIKLSALKSYGWN